MKLPQLKEAKVSGKRVFLRADLDVPLTKLEIRNSKFETKIQDDTRLIAGLETIEYLLKHGAKVIIAGHLGRPEKKFQISNFKFQISNEDKKYSLEAVAEWLVKRFKIYDLRFMNLDGFEGWGLGNNLFLLENLRFYEGEEKNDPVFAKKLARLADVYVNDAFAVSHRAHASIVGVPKYLPHFAGLRLQKEVEVLSGILEHPKRSLVVLIGGAKIETKLPLVEKMHGFADFVLVGGKIAKEVETLLKIKNKHVEEKHAVLVIGELNKNKTDISNKSVREFLEIIKNAGIVVWNGPVGKTQNSELRTKNFEDTEKGTKELARGIVKSGAYTIVGGGDTISFLKRIGLIDRFSFVSTGGGAMLAYLSGEKLPGIEVLRK